MTHNPAATRRRWLRRGCIVAGIAIVVVGVYQSIHLWQEHQKHARERQAADLIAEAARTKNYDAVRNAVETGQIDREYARTAIRAEFQRQAMLRVDTYFKTTPDKRAAYLDSVINEQEDLRAYQRAHPTTNPAATVDNWQLQVVAWAVSQPPETRAQLAEFHRAMEQRRAERGLGGIFSDSSALKKIFGGRESGK